MEIIYNGVFGSHLYGVNNNNSDLDIRQIHKHSLEEIILKKVQNNIQKDEDSEVDFESKELRTFISSCLSGQTFSMDILFTPPNLWKEVSDTWLDIQKNRSKLVTKNMGSFVSYSRGQAGKYSKKGDKLNEIVELKEILEKHKPGDILGTVFGIDDVLKFEHIKIEKKYNTGSKRDETMLKVVESHHPFNRKISDVLKSINLKIDSYGGRSKKASQNKGIDLKAYYHSFRVIWEYEELLTTGELIFPSKRKDLMINMRTGVYTKAFLDHWITEEIERIERIENNLPEPDHKFWDNWLLEQYLKGK